MNNLTIREMEELIDIVRNNNIKKTYSRGPGGLAELTKDMFDFMKLLETYYDMRKGKR